MVSRDERPNFAETYNTLIGISGYSAMFYLGTTGGVFTDLFISAFITSNPYIRIAGAGASAAALGMFGYRVATAFMRNFDPHHQATAEAVPLQRQYRPAQAA